MGSENLLKLETEIVNVLRNIYDPEIPVNIFDLGLIYEINVDDNDNLDIKISYDCTQLPYG